MAVDIVTKNPFLRWAGSKRQLLPALSLFWKDGDYKRYVEPFAGSACLFFDLQPRAAVLGDLNHELMHTYQEVRDNVEAVIECLRVRKSKLRYLELRSQEPTALSSDERAARFIYLNRFCFNGLYRTNQQGQFNVPYSGRKTGRLPSPEHLRVCSVMLQKAKLVVGDFEKTVAKVRVGDFVYMDPPFQVAEKRTFNEYDKKTFGPDDLIRLRTCMEEFVNTGVGFLVSYADCREASVLKKDFHWTDVTVRRNIAGFVARRTSVPEVLISSKPLPDKLRELTVG